MIHMAEHWSINFAHRSLWLLSCIILTQICDEDRHRKDVNNPVPQLIHSN